MVYRDKMEQNLTRSKKFKELFPFIENPFNEERDEIIKSEQLKEDQIK